MGLSVGDVVRAKAGGPVMTVVEVLGLESGPHVRCAWIDGDGAQRADVFKQDDLTPA